MDKKRLLIFFNAALYVLWVLLTSASVVAAYIKGAAYKAQGHPESWIFTREIVLAIFAKFAPLLLAAIVITVVCRAKVIRDPRQDKPVYDPSVISVYKTERKAIRDKAAEAAKERKLRITRIAFLAAAVIFVIAGIFNGSMIDMLKKAVKICTECIGLG